MSENEVSLWKTYRVNVMEMLKAKSKERRGRMLTWALIKTRATDHCPPAYRAPDPILGFLCFLANSHDNPEK